MFMALNISGKIFWLLFFTIHSLAQTQTPNDQTWNVRPAGAGDYQIVLEVSGRVEITRTLKRPDPLDLKGICDAKQTAESSALNSAESYVNSLEKASDKKRYRLEIARLHQEIGQMYSYRGDMPKAIEHFESAYQLLLLSLPEHPEYAADKAYLEEILGIANMRRGELDNCVHHHNAEMCLFPLTKNAQHQNPKGSSSAIEYFTKHLASKPDNLEVRWLLNLAYQTLGKIPPKNLAIPIPAITIANKIARMPDISARAGITNISGAGGSIIDDFDNDGFNDIIFSSVDSCESIRYFHNKGDGTFSDWTTKAKLEEQIGGINCTQTDYNNDGWLDIFVMRGGWEFPMRNSLLKNNGDGTFSDVTAASGLMSGDHRTHSAAWADYDNDGWLDVFVGHEESASQLFKNNKDGTFVDVSAKAGVNKTAFTKGVTFGDYDNDGLADLYVSNYGSENFLYHNNGNGTFTDVAKSLKVEKPIMSFPTWFCDYDNDGFLDLFVASFVPSVTEVARGYLGMPAQAETMKLYHNNGHGGFDDVTAQVKLNRVVPTMGANFGDVDNDGFVDFYLGTGAPSYTALMPNFFFKNIGGKSFVDVTAASGTGHLQKGHGVAFGDINNDGDQDLFVNMGGFIPGDKYNKALFENPNQANGSHWIALKLIGEKSNRAAIGAKIKVNLIDVKGQKSLRYREVNCGGSFGSSSLTQNIGLGKNNKIDKLEIIWPSGQVQVLKDLKEDHKMTIRELK